MSYSKKLQQMEIQKLKRQDLENEAILRSLDVISKRNAIDFANLQKKHTKSSTAEEIKIGKRSDSQFNASQNESKILKNPETEETTAFAQFGETQNKLLNEIDYAKIETVFKQEIYKRNKQRDMKNELYESESFAVNSRDYKRDYYTKKFGVTGSEIHPFVNSLKLYYIEGIIWNYRYYYKGCVSWDWFFPYYYAPLLSDLNNFSKEVFDFQLGEPFNPCEQLLSVLPPFSSHALPKCLQPLLHDDDSEIIDYYPLDFFVGKEDTKCILISRHKRQEGQLVGRSYFTICGGKQD
jgi:5'-3' exoribonuclease 2